MLKSFFGGHVYTESSNGDVLATYAGLVPLVRYLRSLRVNKPGFSLHRHLLVLGRPRVK